MNKLLATLVAGTFAVVASSAFAQTPAPAAPAPSTMEKAKDPKPVRPKYDEKTAQELSSNSATNPAQAKANVDRSKMDPKTRAKYDEQAAQALSSNSATNPAQAKANVAASKEQSAKREKMPDLSKLTKEQKNQLYRQLQKENTGG